MACLFYWLSTSIEDPVEGPGWVARSSTRWQGLGLGQKYIYALYFSVSAFAGLGDQDFYVATPAESMIMILYLLFNIVLQAYILGECCDVMCCAVS